MNARGSLIKPCPSCGRRVYYHAPDFTTPYAHYSTTNPPVLGAWYNCPGPTPSQQYPSTVLREWLR